MARRAAEKRNLREIALLRTPNKGGPFPGQSMLDRMAGKFTVGNECWLWTGTIGVQGYGQIGAGGVLYRAHRVIFELLCGPIPPGMHLDHLCRVRHCVNPGHLEIVSMKENILRGESPGAQNARKTECPRGHPYDEANTGPSRGRPGRVFRRCRACHREAETRRRTNRRSD